MEHPRTWQQKSITIIDRCLTTCVKNLISIPACIGSGKTAVCAYAFGKFIQEHKDEKTVQMFVSPRIRLCKQQIDEIKKELSWLGLIDNKDYKVIRVDCESKDSYDKTKRNLDYAQRHVIFVICDESLWGKDEMHNTSRFNSIWIPNFKNWRDEQNYQFGCCVFDEAHNYQKKQEKIFGRILSWADMKSDKEI